MITRNQCDGSQRHRAVFARVQFALFPLWAAGVLHSIPCYRHAKCIAHANRHPPVHFRHACTLLRMHPGAHVPAPDRQPCPRSACLSLARRGGVENRAQRPGQMGPAAAMMMTAVVIWRGCKEGRERPVHSGAGPGRLPSRGSSSSS